MQKTRSLKRRPSKSEAFVTGFLDGLCAPIDLISGSLEKPLTTKLWDPSNTYYVWVHVGDYLNASIKSFKAPAEAVAEPKRSDAFRVGVGSGITKMTNTKSVA